MSLIIVFPVGNNPISYHPQGAPTCPPAKSFRGSYGWKIYPSPERSFWADVREGPEPAPVVCQSSSTSPAPNSFRNHSSLYCRDPSYFRTGGPPPGTGRTPRRAGIGTTPDPPWSDITRVIGPSAPFFRAGSRTGGLPPEGHAARTGCHEDADQGQQGAKD